MAVSYFGTGAAPTPVASGNLTANYPASVATDDILVCHAVARDNVAITFPGDWTVKHEVNNGAGFRMTVAWKRYGSSDVDTSVLLTHSGGNVLRARVHVARGCVTSGDPFEDADTSDHASADPVAHSTPDLTSITGGGMILYLLGLGDDYGTAYAPPTAANNTMGVLWTERDDAETTTGNDMAMAAYSAPYEAAGTIDIPTINGDPTAAAVGQSWAGYLKPAVAHVGPAIRARVTRQGASQASPAITAPPNVVAGDLCVVRFYSRSPGINMTGGDSGWTELTEASDSGNTQSTGLYWRIHTGSEGTYDFTGTAYGWDFVWFATGTFDPSTPVNDFGLATGSGTAKNSPAADAGVDNSRFLFGSGHENGTSITWTTGAEELVDAYDGGQPIGTFMGVSTLATGTNQQVAYTASAAVTDHQWVVVVNPAPAAAAGSLIWQPAPSSLYLR